MAPIFYLLFDLILAAVLLAAVAKFFPRRPVRRRPVVKPELLAREAEFLHDPEAITASVLQEAARQMKPLQFPDEAAREDLPTDVTLASPRHVKKGDVLVPFQRVKTEDLAAASVLPFEQGGLNQGVGTLSEMIYRRGTMGPEGASASNLDFQDDRPVYYDEHLATPVDARDAFASHSHHVHTPGFDGTFFSDGGSHMGHGGTGGADHGGGFLP